MGLLDKLFKGQRQIAKDEVDQVSWNDLTTTSEVDNIIHEASKKRPQIIFKHSTRCGISRMALSQFEDNYDIPKEAVDAYYLDLLENREVSDYIAEVLNLDHQSPQIILISDGKLVHSESHHGIDAKNVKTIIDNEAK